MNRADRIRELAERPEGVSIAEIAQEFGAASTRISGQMSEMAKRGDLVRIYQATDGKQVRVRWHRAPGVQMTLTQRKKLPGSVKHRPVAALKPLKPAPVATRPPKVLWCDMQATTTSVTRVMIVPTPPDRFSVEPGFVGEFEADWRERRA